MSQSIVWVSGATHGMGAGLARLASGEGARVVNLDRIPSDEFETVTFDLAKPETLRKVGAHFREVFEKGDVSRATLLVVGHASIGHGVHSLVDLDHYEASLVANGVAPIMLGTLFLRSLPDDVAGGLMMMSSGAAAWTVLGQSSYSACKCAIEGWTRVIRDEVARERRNVWITAVRPGIVDTPSARETATADPALYPRAQAMGENLKKYGVSIETAARRIWDALPPPADARIVSFDGKPERSPEFIP